MSCLYPRMAFYDTRGENPRVLFKAPNDFWYVHLPEGVSTISCLVASVLVA